MGMTSTVPVLAFPPSPDCGAAPTSDALAEDIFSPRSCWLRLELMDAVVAQAEKGDVGFIVNDVV